MTKLNDARVVRDVVVVAASAGGIDALSRLLSQLEPRLGAGLAIVFHRSQMRDGHIRPILQRVSTLPVLEPPPSSPFMHDMAYLAPRDHHLVFDGVGFAWSRGPMLHHVRPAADALFMSAARAYGPRVLGIVLSGCGFDGARGCLAIKDAGGLVVVQSPDDAEFPFMPKAAMTVDHVDATVPVARMPALIRALAAGEAVSPES